MQPTKVFAKAGLGNVTSAMCHYQQRFQLDAQFSALVHNFKLYIFNWAFVPGRTFNEFPAFANTRRWCTLGT